MLLAARPALAQPAFDLVLDLGVAYGGDRVATLYFTDGETQTMRAGQGGTVAGGLRVRPSAASPLALRATAGVKFMTSAAENASIWLTRVPVEAALTYSLTPDVWVGAGYVHHAGVRFRADDVAPDLRFEAGPGVLAEAGWRWLGLRYTAQTYTDETGARYNAGNVGVVARLALPVR